MLFDGDRLALLPDDHICTFHLSPSSSSTQEEPEMAEAPPPPVAKSKRKLASDDEDEGEGEGEGDAGAKRARSEEPPAAPAAAKGPKREQCRYGGGCYRKNPAHRQVRLDSPEKRCNFRARNTDQIISRNERDAKIPPVWYSEIRLMTCFPGILSPRRR